MITHPYARLCLVAACAATPATAMTGCHTMNHQAHQQPVTTDPVPMTAAQTRLTPAVKTVIGDYANDGYDKRLEGYDWMTVKVRPHGSDQINIQIRARADIKKPSCYFNGQATLMGQDDALGVIFETIANDSKTFLQFKNGKLTIDSTNQHALNYFCSGGASLAGNYQRLVGGMMAS